MSSQFMNAFYAGSGSLKSNTNLAFLACDGNQGNALGIYVNPDIITILLGTGSTLRFNGSVNNPIISFRQKYQQEYITMPVLKVFMYKMGISKSIKILI